MISAKLTLHVTDADTSGKADASPISKLASSISKIPSSAEVACDKCGQIWKRILVVVSEQAQLLRKLAPLRFLSWPLRFLSSTLRSLKSRRVLIFIEVRMTFKAHLNFYL
ncbi:hypothetical protein ACFX19_003349 [Malus domestica]